jgi:hypothetical protein
MSNLNHNQQFTKENAINTLKGLFIASTGAFALGVLNWLGTIQLEDPTLTMIISVLVPTLTNLLKEYLRTDK